MDLKKIFLRDACPTSIGGQAVLEGVMMKNKEQYAVAVRKPDGEIDVETDVYPGVMHGSRLKTIPFIRGVFNFADSFVCVGVAIFIVFYVKEEITNYKKNKNNTALEETKSDDTHTND